MRTFILATIFCAAFIALDAPALAVDPNYEFAASDTESSTTGTDWVDKAPLTFSLESNDAWIILAFAEYKDTSTTVASKVQLLVDGNVQALAQTHDMVRTGGDYEYLPFCTSRAMNLGSGEHTMKIQYAREASGGTTYIRRARIAALRKNGIGFYSTASDGAVTLPDYRDGARECASLSWTPGSTGTFLLVYSAEVTSNWDWLSVVDTFLDSTNVGQWVLTDGETADYNPLLGFAVVDNVTGGVSHTAKITAFQENDDPDGPHHIRRCRIAALRISGNRFGNHQDVTATTDSATDLNTFDEAQSLEWTPATGNWLILNSSHMQGQFPDADRGMCQEVRVQLNDSTTCAQQFRRFAFDGYGNWLDMTSVDVQDLPASQQTVDVDHRRIGSEYYVYLRRTVCCVLPLDE